MAKGVNIHQLRGGCASLEVHFSSDVADEIEDFGNAQTKLELARQLRDQLHDPNGEWMTLSSDIKDGANMARWIRRIAENSSQTGRAEAEGTLCSPLANSY
jgi:hypothetical protein